MKLLCITLLSFILFSPQVKSTSLNSNQLDQFIVEACSMQSPKEHCIKKMTTIKNGISSKDLLNLAPTLKIDSNIQTTIIKNPTTFISSFYCLAIFNDVISMKQVPVNIFPYVVYGFSFSSKSLSSYSKWLKTKAAVPCIESLKSLKLEPSLVIGDKLSNIILNPITFLENGTGEAFVDMAVRNYNHERLHAIYALEKAKTKVEKLWKTLTKGEQGQFKSEHLHYNFKNSEILYKEFFSFTFETNPEVAYQFLSSNPTYAQIKKTLCRSCLAASGSFKIKIQELASLKPEDLLKKIEEEKIKILILSSGRKDPKTLFHWGQIRQDSGELNQISAIEGAMGKTLCQGEKPESKDSITIVLASDSPYSTLIHEYIHTMQIKQDASWCPVSKRLWSDKPSPFEIRMVRDREWDVRLILWNLLNTPHMNIEDQIIVTEGILRESEGRKNFDPSASRFLVDNKIQIYLNKKIEEYKKAIIN